MVVEQEKKEFLFSDIKKGMRLPTVTYTITSEILERYLEGVDDLNPLYLDEEFAKTTPYRGRIVPPMAVALCTTISNFIKPLNWRIPAGLIQASQKFEFSGVIRPDEQLRLETIVEDKFEKKEKKFAVFKTEIFNEKGDKVVTSWLTPIWPR